MKNYLCTFFYIQKKNLFNLIHKKYEIPNFIIKKICLYHYFNFVNCKEKCNL